MKFKHEKVQQYWDGLAFNQASPIQLAAYSPISQGQSLYLQAPTGSGKTLAYLLPAVEKVQPGQGLQVVVFAPSQELTVQIFQVVKDLADQVGFKALALPGGANLRRQIDNLKDKPDLIVATPGRFLEILKSSRKLKLHLVETVIYDEADYLLAQEHENIFDQIRQGFNRDIQSVYVSATMEADFMDRLKNKGLNLTLIQANQDQDQKQHYYIQVNDRKKIDQLRRLGHLEGMLAIVFFEQINHLDKAYDQLSYRGIPVVKLHSQMNQIQRQQTMKAFQDSKCIFLLTTDLAARGLDLPDIPYVIHYNVPDSLETYIHRSGRTGRMGKFGQIISLVNEQEARDLNQLLSPQDIRLEERVLFQGRLLSLSDRDLLAETNRRPQAIKSKPKPVNTGSSKAKSVFKKKKRHLHQKNKGKPKPKS